MKKMFLLLLFIPSLLYSQITYKDIMSINSEETFKRLVIENGFEFDKRVRTRDPMSDLSGVDFYNILNVYGLNLDRDNINGNKSSLWGEYSTEDGGRFCFQFFLKSEFDTSYHEIINEIKKNCTFLDIKSRKGGDYVCYHCPESTFKGNVGFTVYSGFGIIRNIIPNIFDYPIEDHIESINKLNSKKE